MLLAKCSRTAVASVHWFGERKLRMKEESVLNVMHSIRALLGALDIEKRLEIVSVVSTVPYFGWTRFRVLVA